MGAQKDKYKAVWVSHSSMSDFLNCPRLYYLRNVYKNPKNGHKMTIVSPPLSLGQVVHEVIEGLSVLPVENRLSTPLSKIFEKKWEKVSGEKSGFITSEEEDEYKDRGVKMLNKLEENPGPIVNKAIKIKADGDLPYYWFSQQDNIILCGKIDWMEYLEDSNSIHIIDFKTGKRTESEDSLQLPAYLLLASNLQNRKVEKMSYWYLENGDNLVEQTIPSIDSAYEKVAKVAQRVKLARKLNLFKCPQGTCYHCRPFERVLRGEGKLVGVSDYRQDMYVLKNNNE